ncbi:MAG TPA: tetratricopeptide repeat protein [Pyrinomonadaceae bacterium]
MISSKPIQNPFPGLRPFETDEYRLFFGREGQSDELIARLQRARFLAVVGTSGSGKSSLIRAGLMPALRGGMMKGAGSGWRIAVMRPGGNPIGNLAAELVKKDALCEAGAGLPEDEAEAVIEATLRSGSLGILNVARQARLSEHEKLLIVVDQFEELFRFRAAHERTSVDEAAAFVKLLLEAAQQRELSIYIVLTMRSDFLGDCAQFQGLPEAINDGQYLIPRMTRDERRFAVTGPVGVTRGKITEPLINRLLNDVGDNPDQLPILQHALMRTWDHWQTHRRDGEPMGIEHYEAIGTMSDALSRHADEAFNELPDERSRKIAELLFKALSERGADNREIRRPTRLGTLCKIADASMNEVIAVIDVFRRGGRSFLMPPAGTPLHADCVIDISHESLIRNWQRLKEWVNEEAQSVRFYRRVAEAAMLHREGSEGLMQEPALSFVLDWREKSQPNAAWGQRYHPEFETAMAYLEQSHIANEKKIAEEKERDRRELEQAKLFAAQQARAARRMRAMIFALCVILLLALATAAYAWSLRSVAVNERENAFRSARLAEDANKRAQSEADLAHKSEQAAVAAREDATKEEHKAEDAAKVANEQKAIALTNLRAAQSATAEAKQATAQAQQNAQQLAEALERGQLLRVGLESSRREDFDLAQESFEKLEQKLKALQSNGTQKYTPQQLKQLKNDYGWTLSHLGDTYHKQLAFEKAIEHYEKGRVVLESVLGNEPAPILLETYHGLARAYHDSAKARASATPTQPSTASLTPEQQLAKAEEFYKKAASYQELMKPDNPLVLVTSLKNLSELYSDIGRYDDAERSLKTIVETYKTIENLPGNRDRTVVALKDLAEFYRSRTRYEDAARTYNELIDIQEALTDTQSDPEAIRALSDNYNELSQIYNALNDEVRNEAAFRLAERIQKMALKLRNQRALIADLKKLHTAITMDEDLDVMGDSYIKLERFTEAAHAYEAALSIREQISSEQKSVSVSYLKLGDLYREQLKNYAKAEEYYKKLVQISKSMKGSLTGPSDPLTQYITGLRKLAALYTDDMNKPAETEAVLNEALTATAPINGRLAWDDELNIYGDLLHLYQKQNKDVQPIQVRKLETMTRRRDDFANAYRSPDHQQFMSAYVNAAGDVADSYLKQNNKAAAEAAYAQVFNFIHLSTVFLDAKKLDNYLTNLEKYQSLLRDNNEAAKAAEFDAFVKEGRERQKDIESIQKEIQSQQQAPKP